MDPQKPQTLMVVAGDPSGDIHAARVVRALLAKRKTLRVFGMGGPSLAAAGMDVREDLTRQALIGFSEVARHLPLVLRRFRECEKWLREEKPALLVLVDYPGFNLRLAQKAYALGVPVCYYVAPQVWAWHPGRIALMKKVIQKLLVILPFEKEFFKKEGMDAVYVGHPLLEEVRTNAVRPPSLKLRGTSRNWVLKGHGIEPGFPALASYVKTPGARKLREAGRFPLICAMPGSRGGEIRKIWPLYLEASRLLREKYPDAAFVVPRPSGIAYTDYKGLKSGDSFFFVDAPAFGPRQTCDLAWVKSGTGTLETALLGIPMVITYKVSRLSGFLAKKLLKVKHVGLVNLLSEKPVVPELLQEKATPESLVRESLKILESPPERVRQLKAFTQVKKCLSHPAKASENAAREILKLLAEKKKN